MFACCSSLFVIIHMLFVSLCNYWTVCGVLFWRLLVFFNLRKDWCVIVICVFVYLIVQLYFSLYYLRVCHREMCVDSTNDVRMCYTYMLLLLILLAIAIILSLFYIMFTGVIRICFNTHHLYLYIFALRTLCRL